jgi:transposase
MESQTKLERILAKVTDDEVRQFIIEQATQLNEQAIRLSEQEVRLVQLQEQVKILERALFGKKSEKHIPKSQDTGEEVPEGKLPVFDSQENDEVEVSPHKRKKPKKTKNELIDYSKLPQVQKIHDLAEEQKQCGCCQSPLTRVGEDRTTQLEVIPSQIIVIEHIRPKYVCRTCEELKMAPKEPSAIPKSLAGDSLLAKICVDKYAYHLPLYRQSKIFLNQGLDISDYSLGRWLMEVGEIIKPLYEAAWEELLSAPYLQVDETPVNCLEAKKKSYMWVYVKFSEQFKPELVVFDFQMTREAVSVEERLKDYKGIVQTDGYAGYDGIGKKESIIGVRCGAHIRRKFENVTKLSKGPHPIADQVLAYFKQLYEIEEKMRLTPDITVDKRKETREKESRPIVDQLYQLIQDAAKSTSPKNTLGKAIAYALNMEVAWSRYLEHGEAEIDTNWVENQMRPIGVGRRNWLFIGNREGGIVGAMIYTLQVSAVYNNLEPWAYMFYVLKHHHKIRKGIIQAKDLLPHRVDPVAVNNFAKAHLHEIIELMNNVLPIDPSSL